MTTTSSLAFPGMEVPAGEDLEMASPYQGQTDDFDIDIDLMEEQDQGSNMDSDMLGAEDLFNTSHPSLFPNDPTDDADMADEASEGSMVDADNVPDHDQDIDIQFEEVTQEAEMLEDDTTTATTSLLPSINFEITEPAQDEQSQPAQDIPHTTETAEHVQAAEVPLEPETTNDLPSAPNALESVQRTHESTEQARLDPGLPEIVNSGNPSTLDNAVGNATSAGDNTKAEELVEEEPEVPEVPASSEEHDVDSSHKVEPKDGSVETQADQTENAETEIPAVVKSEAPAPLETQYDAAHNHQEETLHPIKVLYQDSEISLFPPLEGDSAETFFLHDEDLAYESFDKLFGALRDVLLDNVTEHEILVIDIDSLGIQLAEVSTYVLFDSNKSMLTCHKDSSHTAKTTLHQILNIYLRLCRNDSAEEPEAFYLNLSTKPDIQSEINNLEGAAEQGKGLSEIQPWGDDNFDEAEQEATEARDEPSKDEGDFVDDEHEAHNAEAGSGADTETAEYVAELSHGQEETHNLSEKYENAPDDKDHVEEHDQSEGPKTGSTSTVVPSAESVESTQQLEDGHTIGPGDDQEHHVDEEDEEEYNQDEDDENVSPREAPQVFDESEHREDQTVGEELHAAIDTHIPEEDAQHDSASVQDAEQHFAESNDAFVESETPLDNGHLGSPKGDDQEDQEPEEDFVGLSEDLTKSPVKADQGEDFAHYGDDEEAHFEDGPAEPDAYEEDFDEQQDNDDGFHDGFEGAEEFELGENDPLTNDSQTNDTLSVKRSREQEDEWDVEDSTTPETKRRRPS